MSAIWSWQVKVLHDYKARLTANETKAEQACRDSDKIVVPIILRTSLAVLKKIDELPHETRDLVIREALKDPLGQKAFAEAGQMHQALEKRFGSDYRSCMGEHMNRLASGQNAQNHHKPRQARRKKPQQQDKPRIQHPERPSTRNAKRNQ